MAAKSSAGNGCWERALGVCEGRTDLIRGRQYFEEGRIDWIEQIESLHFQAEVHGTRPYLVEVQYDESRKNAGYAIDCTCPRFESCGICKHVFALFCALAHDPTGQTCSPHRDRSGSYALDEEEEVEVHAGRFLCDNATGEVIPSFATVVADIIVPPDTAVIRSPQASRLWFTLEGDILDTNGLIPVLVWSQRQNKNGSWKKPELFDRFRGMEKSTLAADDSSLLDRLEESSVPVRDLRPEWMKGSRYALMADHAGSPTAVVDMKGYWLPSETSRDVISQLVSHERFIFREYISGRIDEFDPEEGQRLSWSDTVLELQLQFESHEASGWLMSGSIDGCRSDQPVVPYDISVLSGWHYGIVDGVLHPLGDSIRCPAFELFRENDQVFISPSELPMFRAWIEDAENEPVQEFVPRELRGRIGCCEPSPSVDVKYEAEMARVVPRFHYADLPIADGDPETLYDTATDSIVVRDLKKESDLVYELVTKAYQFPRVSVDTRTNGVTVPREHVLKLLGQLEGWSVTFSGKRVRQPGNFNISVTTDVDWFDMEAHCDYGGVAVPLPRLLRAVREGATTIELPDGSQGLVPENLDPRLARLAQVGEVDGDSIRFRSSQALLLDAMLEGRNQAMTDAGFRKLRDRLKRFEGIEPVGEPRGFQGELRQYQKEGLGWLTFLEKMQLGGCLADDMGLGKTIQVLALLQRRKLGRRSAPRRPSLVVVPRSLVFNWIDEAARFTPRLKVLNYTGIERKEHRDSFDQYDLIVTTYGVVRRDIGLLEKIEFDYVILDEATAIKNASSQNAKAARLLRARHRLAMTGTPVENHLGELWSLFEFLNPGLLGRAAEYKSLARQLSDDETLAWLRKAVAPYILRRTKEEVLTDLPPKTEQTIVCELSAAERRQYDELRRYYQSLLDRRIKEKGLQRAKIHVLEALLRLRQAACHPGLIDKKQRKASSAKIEALLEQLKEIVSENHKALVFSQFTSLLAVVKRQLEGQGITYEYLDGRTRKRKDKVERFQNDPDCPVFLISLKAGGHGLNLTAADYVFILDPWWNPAVEAQAVDRAHRIGQEKRVFAYRFIAKDTVEEKVVALQDQKRELAEAIVASNGSLMSRLTVEDLQVLLS